MGRNLASRMTARDYNQDFYDEFWNSCSDFTRFNPGARHRRRVIGEILQRLKFETLLDVGCGPGDLLVHLQQYFNTSCRFSGVDLSSEIVKLNQTRFPKMDFEVLDIEKQSLGRQYDMVVCSEVIEHLDHQKAAIENLSKMVKPGGYLLVTCPTGKIYDTETHFGHVSHPTPIEFSSLAQGTGLSVERILNWGWPAYKALKWATNVNTEWALKNFASGQYGAFQKFVSNSLYWVNFLNQASSPRGCQLFVLFKMNAN